MIRKVPLSQEIAIRQIEECLPGMEGATIFHTPMWNRIVAQEFNTQFFFLVSERDGCPNGVMACHLVAESDGRTVCHSPPRMFEIPYGGPVATGPEVRRVVLSLIKAASRSNHIRQLTLFTSPEVADWPVPRLWKWGELVTARVDLQPPLQDIWMHSLDGKRRNMIRKAEKRGVKIRHGGNELLHPYYELVEQMAHRTGLCLRPKRYYAQVLDAFGCSDMARLYLTFHDGRPLAGGIFLRYASTAYYWHGATGDDVPNLGQGELIQWHVIQWAKEAGCHWYDLVGIERERLPHIARFKLGFSEHLAPFRSVNYVPLVYRVLRRILGFI